MKTRPEVHPTDAIRVLIVEDDALDAELICDELRNDGLDFESLLVDDESGYVHGLDTFAADVVVSDLNVPGFSGYRALEILRKRGSRLPFIFVSGTIGEDAAIQALKGGATDYLLKGNLARLASAVRRAVEQAREIAARERAEEELLRAQRFESLAMLAGGISHDLRNILQPLLLTADVLKDSDQPALHKHGELVGDCARRGLEMVASMLSFARGAHMQSEQVRLSALFDALALLLSGSVPRNIELVLEKSPTDVLIEGNHTELQQCLLNLCLNALQAMPEGGRLVLSAEAAAVETEFFAEDELHMPGAYLKIKVTDTGIGMDERVRNSLFQPFFTTKDTGTGLGLVSCKRIVTNHRGYLRVLSEPGQGTTFEVYLPLPGAAANDGDAQIARGGEGEHVLVVVERLGKQTMLSDTLELNGYRVTTAGSGAHALQRVSALGLPDLVVMDADLSLMSGVQTIAGLLDRGYAGPLILLVRRDRPVDPDGLPPVRHIRFVEKPVSVPILLRSVREELDDATSDASDPSA